MIKGSGAWKIVCPAGRWDDGHLGSLAERGTHMGNPYWNSRILTRYAWVLIVGCKFRFGGVAGRVHGVGIVDAYNLATFECNLAIKAQRLDDASIAGCKKLRDLHETSDCSAIDVIAEDL
jgi:hypothetical protein